MLWDSVYVGVVGKVMSRERKSGRLLWALGVIVLVLILSVGHTFGFCVCQYGESFVPLPSNHAAGLTSRTNCPASWMCSTSSKYSLVLKYSVCSKLHPFSTICSMPPRKSVILRGLKSTTTISSISFFGPQIALAFPRQSSRLQRTSSLNKDSRMNTH
ncbi:hypothetical protein EV424DRAFT_895874 [Suillus variegatus]|nr:hypothetical protein EV424DRAFT_895874 [Suillus variegatus]